MNFFRGAGSGFVKTQGGWEESHDGEKVQVTERSLMIPNVSREMENNEETAMVLFDLCNTAADMYDQ